MLQLPAVAGGDLTATTVNAECWPSEPFTCSPRALPSRRRARPLGTGKALPIISSLCSSLRLMPEALVDKWRVYADKHNLPENKPMDASALNK